MIYHSFKELFKEFHKQYKAKTMSTENLSSSIAPMKLPTVGRIIHYFPVSDKHCQENSATVLPATVVQVFGNRLNIAVTCMNNDGPVVLRYSVPHKDFAGVNEEGKICSSYWDWPEIK